MQQVEPLPRFWILTLRNDTRKGDQEKPPRPGYDWLLRMCVCACVFVCVTTEVQTQAPLLQVVLHGRQKDGL